MDVREKPFASFSQDLIPQEILLDFFFFLLKEEINGIISRVFFITIFGV